MKKQNASTNTMEQLDDLLEKGILTAEEYEAKKQQIALTESDTSQGQSKQSLVEKVKQFYAIVSPKLAPVKSFAMKRKKLTCAVLAFVLLVLGFFPGYSVGKKHTSNVQVTFGSPDESIEVKGKGSSKNPYHLSEDIVFETFNTDCGQYVTYTITISRILRASALSRYMTGNSQGDAGLIGSITATWEDAKVKDVSRSPDIGIVYQGNSRSHSIGNDIYLKDGTSISRLSKNYTYQDVVFKSIQLDDKEFDYILINYKTKEGNGKMVEYKIYVTFDPKVVEN